METLMPQADAAEYLHQSPRTLERWRLSGFGPAYVKCGKKVFYTPTALAEFVAKNTRQSTSQKAA